MIVLSTFVFILGIIVPILALSNIKLWIEFKALQKSTHTVAYVNAGEQFQEITDKIKQDLTKEPFDNIL